ncbi:MAG: hypothetical protein U0V75_13490 [Ferruginibacter sp.]
MKNILLLFIAVLITGTAAAQKNFEGEITHRLHASAEDKPDAELKVLFGPHALRLRFKEKELYDKDEVIVLFDSAAYYTLLTATKTYKKKALSLKPELAYQKNKTIAGYSTTAFLEESNSLNQLLGGYMMMHSSVFYLADSLQYEIPPGFGGNPVFSAVHNNKIVLGATIVMQAGFSEAADGDKNKITLTAEAIDIKPMHFPDSLFTIPADYSDGKNAVSDNAVYDTTYAAVDTAIIEKPVKKAAKKPVKPTGKKAGNQPAAIRRKQ